MSIRVLHVVTYMGRGGLETMIMNYYRHIDRSKVQFDFLVHRDFEADYDKEILSLGGKIYRLPPLNPFSRTYISRLDDFFEKHREYKIVHSHLDCMASIPLKSAKKYGVPVCIAHAHNNNQIKDKKYILKLLYKKSISTYADFLFACGQEAGKWMFSGADFFVLNNAIDAKLYIYDESKRRKVRSDLGIEDNILLIGHVGRFSLQKNHMFIIKVFNAIEKKSPSARLLLVGDGELISSVKEEVNRLHLQNKVIFAGLRSDVADLLQAMDVFLFPSLNEGLPLAIMEAQAAGVPCIISERVPSECKKTDLVYQCNLSDDIDKWSDTVISVSKQPRKNVLNEIIASGFDIESNAEKLQRFYLNCYKYQQQKEKIQWQQ